MNMKQSCKALICAIEGELDGRHCTEEQAAAILDHALPSLTEALALAESERDRYKAAWMEFMDRTDWMQEKGQVLAKYLGQHRAEVLTAMLNEARAALATQPAVPDEADQFFEQAKAELRRARAKFPGDRIMTLALAEEFGELCKAVLDESAEAVRKEAVQVACMAARVVLDGDGSVVDWRRERGLDPLLADAAMRVQGDGGSRDA